MCACHGACAKIRRQLLGVGSLHSMGFGGWIQVFRPDGKLPYLLSHHTSLCLLISVLCFLLFSLGMSVICSHFLSCRLDTQVVDLRSYSFPIGTLFEDIKPLRTQLQMPLTHVDAFGIRFLLLRNLKFLLWFLLWSSDDSKSYLFSRRLRVAAWPSCGSLLRFHSSWKAHYIISMKRKFTWSSTILLGSKHVICTDSLLTVSHTSVILYIQIYSFHHFARDRC